jgi:hypothetical protein
VEQSTDSDRGNRYRREDLRAMVDQPSDLATSWLPVIAPIARAPDSGCLYTAHVLQLCSKSPIRNP